MTDFEPARLADADAIDRVLRAAFADPIEAKLVTVLREGHDLRRGCSTVAREDGVVGYAAVSNADLLDAPEIELAVLGPVAVRPDRQGEGIGSTLIRETIRVCVRTGCDAVVLEGDPDFYERFGFDPAETYGLESDLDPPPGTFQVWECWPDALADVSDVVRHPAPFHAL